MTSLHLLLWIAFGIALQLAIFLAITFWRHRQDYAALKERASDGTPMPASQTPAARPSGVESWTGFRPFKVAQKVIEDGAQSVCSFYLEPEDGKPLPAFLPGQFLTFRLDMPAGGGATEQIVRCYSLSDAPSRKAYRVSIKRVPAPTGTEHPPGRSSNFFHDDIQVGGTLQVRAPSGHFHIDRSDTPVVLVGGGIGITPMMSMLNWCAAEQPGREVWLFYGVRNGREVVMKPHLDKLAAAHPNVHLRLCFSNPLPEDRPGRDYQHEGRVDLSLFRMELPLKPYHFYICGPAPMMETLVPALEDWGVPDSHLHFEAFGPASIKRRNAAAPTAVAAAEASAGGVVVTFAKSGKQVPWQSGAGTLLELAEANGIPVNSGCRAGGCGSCQTTINAGEVAYRQAPDYDPEPGSCLLCVCTPKTSVTLEA
ncbi:MAG: oxidoreductase FAD/NAD(P)-binding domain protein [Rhodocyclaceae bacterium]|nr:oxidoreductase FAD/NAD(P)-binding domain protein [Rhodocyclaceae bacterium]